MYLDSSQISKRSVVRAINRLWSIVQRSDNQESMIYWFISDFPNTSAFQFFHFSSISHPTSYDCDKCDIVFKCTPIPRFNRTIFCDPKTRFNRTVTIFEHLRTISQQKQFSQVKVCIIFGVDVLCGLKRFMNLQYYHLN